MTDVRGPDGTINRFPDDMPDAEIEKAMAAAYGAPKQAPAKRSIMQDINSGFEQAADSATLGVFGNYRAAIDSAMSGGKEGFLGSKARNTAAVENFNQRRPLAGVASRMIGGVAPALATMGGSQALQAARVAPQGFLGRRMADAVSGGVYGTFAGANQAMGQQDPMQMLGTIAQNAGFGAVAGPVFGGSFEGAAKIGAMLPRITVDQNVLGMSGSNIRMKPKTPSTRDIVAQEQLKLLNQGKTTPEQLRQDYTDYQNAGINPTLAEIGGPRTKQRGRTLANSPGKTAALAQEVIDAGRNTQLPKAVERTNQAFGQTGGDIAPSKSSQIIADVAAKKEAMGNVYNSLFNPRTKIRPEGQPLIDKALKRIPPKDMADAEASISRYAVRDEVDPTTLSEAQRYKYIKEHMDDVIQNLEKRPTEQRKAIQAQKALVDALEAGVPGYKDANKVYEALSKRKDAIDFGGSLLVGGRSQMSLADARVAKSKMSQQEIEAVQAGLRDDIERILNEASGSVDGPRNVIAAMKNSYADKIRLWLGPQSESYIRALRTLGKSYRDESFMYPGSGSNTYASQMDDADSFLNIKPTRQGMMSMIDEAAGAAMTKATTPWREKLRNQQGKLLFQRMTREDIDRIAAQLANQQDAMRRAGQASRPSGLFGAQFSNRQEQ